MAPGGSETRPLASLSRVTRSLRLKVLLVVLILGSASGAAALTYSYYYANSTATVRTPDVTLAAGTDASGSCSAYPCSTVNVPATGDTATVSLSFFPANTGASPVPASYYSNLVQIKNSGSGAHTITGISVFSFGGTLSAVGQVTVYYCTTQTEFSVSGSLSGCQGSYSFDSSVTTGTVGTAFTGSQSIGAGATQYIEIKAYASSTATAGQSVTFEVAVEWA